MRIRRKGAIVAVVIVSVAVTVWLARYLYVPPVSAEAVRAEILALTPLGSDAADIDKAVEKIQGKSPFWQDKDGKKRDTSVNYRSFYQWRHLPWETQICAQWHLDAEGRLADVSLKYLVVSPWVHKEIPAP